MTVIEALLCGPRPKEALSERGYEVTRYLELYFAVLLPGTYALRLRHVCNRCAAPLPVTLPHKAAQHIQAAPTETSRWRHLPNFSILMKAAMDINERS